MDGFAAPRNVTRQTDVDGYKPCSHFSSRRPLRLGRLDVRTGTCGLVRTGLKQSGIMNGAPGVIRTRDLLLRRQALYPAELRAHKIRANNPNSLSCPSLRRQSGSCAARTWTTGGLTLGWAT